MRKLAFLAAAAIVAAFATPASAEGWYAGVGYTQYDADAIEVGGVTGRLGYGFHPNFAVEGEGSFGVDDDAGAELNNSWGVYGVGKLPVSESFDVFARAGWHQTEFEGGGIAAEEDGAAYGAGVQWNLNPSFGIRADVTRLEGDEDVDTVGVGGVWSF